MNMVESGGVAAFSGCRDRAGGRGISRGGDALWSPVRHGAGAGLCMAQSLGGAVTGETCLPDAELRPKSSRYMVPEDGSRQRGLPV